MSTLNPFSFLKNQVRSALEREAKLTPGERRMFSWQFVVEVAGVHYLVGKGGANTMFYMVGMGGERKTALPQEMLDIIGKWAGEKYVTYVVAKTKTKMLAGPVPSIKNLLENTEFPNGVWLCGITKSGKMIRLYRMKRGLMGGKWVKRQKE